MATVTDHRHDLKPQGMEGSWKSKLMQQDRYSEGLVDELSRKGSGLD